MSVQNTIIIPHLRNPGVVRCLKTLWKNTPHNFRVILVDQDEKDLSKEVKDMVHLHIKAYRPLGFAKACNTGWRIADTEYVTLVNDDVEFIDKRWWEGILSAFKEDVVAVNPKTPRDYEAGGQIVNKVEYREDFTEIEYNNILKLPWSNQQCMAMFCTVFKQEVAKKIGFFDEYFYPGGGEDTDWTIRAKGLREPENKFRGYEVISTPLSYVWHWWQQSATDPTFMKARIQLREKWGWDMSMPGSTTQKVIPKLTIKQL